MSKVYRVQKYEDKNDRWLDYGPLPLEDVVLVVKGYKREEPNTGDEFLDNYLKELNTDDIAGMYSRKGTGNFYEVIEC